MKRAMILTAAALFATQALSFGDDNANNPNNASPGAATPSSVRTDASQDQNSSSEGGDKSLLSRGDMSEKDFDADWTLHADLDNATEIQIAKIAESKSQNPQVKQLAQTLIQDHQQAEEQLKQIAQSKGYQWPSQLDEVGTAKVAEFQKKTGPALDRAFVYANVGDHVCDILKYKAGSQLVTDPELKQYIQKTLPVLHHHLQAARQLAGGSEAMTAGHHIHGTGASDTQGQTQQPGASNDTSGNSQPGGTAGTTPRPTESNGTGK